MARMSGRDDAAAIEDEVATFPASRLRLMSAFGAVGQGVLLLAAFLLPVVSDYTLLGDTVSELVLGQYGGVQVFAFLMGGLSALGLAAVLRELTPGSKGSAIGCTLIGIYAIGMLGCAVFPTDRIDEGSVLQELTRVGTIHLMCATIGLASMVVAMFFLTNAFRRDCRWQSMVQPSALLAMSAFALVFAQTQGSLAGLMQRLLLTVISAWLVVAAIKARSVVVTTTRPKAATSHPSGCD